MSAVRQLRCTRGHTFAPELPVCPECAEPARSPGRPGRSMSMALGLAAALAVIAAVVLAFVLSQRQLVETQIAARETAALQRINILNAAQIQYHTALSQYAATLAHLGPPADGVPTADAANLIPADLAAGLADGYLFSLRRTGAGYEVTAVPSAFGVTGRRAFYSDQTLVVREAIDAPATAASHAIQ